MRKEYTWFLNLLLEAKCIASCRERAHSGDTISMFFPILYSWALHGKQTLSIMFFLSHSESKTARYIKEMAEALLVRKTAFQFWLCCIPKLFQLDSILDKWWDDEWFVLSMFSLVSYIVLNCQSVANMTVFQLECGICWFVHQCLTFFFLTNTLVLSPETNYSPGH